MRRKKGQLLGLDEVEAAFSEMVEILGSEGYALCGGLAMQLYGSRRLTADVDFIVEKAAPEMLPHYERKLSFGGVSGRSSNDVPVDLIERDDDYAALYEAALEHTTKIDRRVVVKPEFLAAMKLAAGRPKDEEDLRFLLTEVLRSDRQRMEGRRIVKRYLGAYAAAEWDSMLAEALWRKRANR